MKLTLKKIILNNIPVKIISLILGYSFWFIVSQSHVSDIWFDVPICFYQVPKNIEVQAPEKIRIQLSGKRIDLYTIDKDNLAFHINMQNSTAGKQILKLTNQLLFIPEKVKMARCCPANITILNREKENISA